MTNTAPYGRPEAARISQKADFDFIINRIIGKHRTVTLVQVVAVKDESGSGEPDTGCVDIKPLVMAKDAQGTLYSHGTIYNVPFFRLQGGSNAIVIDPHVGDIGIAVIADRDISNVKSTKAEAPPGSDRRYSLDQALYIGGLLNGEPQQYIKFTSKGIEITSPTAVTINAPTLTFNGNEMIVNAKQSVAVQTQTVNLTATQTFNVVSPQSAYTGKVIINGIDFDTHKHQDVQPGKGLTGLPSA
ncbi:Gp138 family membrane-puncturing spike protein [Zymobacter palmae]|uniref:Uncharacterized conserved protein n=1 Tax=Zymobacter palmae TaxID=33074 RepID=A0A348HFQ4_9GAMM|nr:Gp138 family membrane-puncturing spike protein [Zymobacter palmae]BBG30456.1 uncharacterized conserved protein [Zymobacter palmae]